MRRALVVLAASFLSAPPAFAADWETAFPASAVKTYVSGSGVKVLVIGAGGDAADRDAATSAIMDALRASTNVKLVMSGDSLGSVTDLDDATIVAKARSMPVDRILVVRVFPASAGNYSAVVTMYRTDGAVEGAFTAASNEPLVANVGSGSSSPAGGLSGQAVAAVTAATDSARGDMDARIKGYEERRIWLQGWAAVDGSTGRVVSTWSVPQLGRYGEPLKPKEFYEVVGREDLVTQYKQKNAVRAGLAVGGLAVMAGGLAYPTLLTEKPKGGRSRFECETLYTSSSTSTSSTSSSTSSTSSKAVGKGTTEDCAYNEAHNIYDKQASAWIVGGTVASLGYITVMVPLFINPNPASANERLKMVDEYNADLRKELGLPDSVGAAPVDDPKPTPTAVLWASPTHVTLSVEF